MNILICPDSFKHCLRAIEVARALEAGVKAYNPTWNCRIKPMADGGEGTLDALEHSLNARRIKVLSEDALGRPLWASYLLSRDKQMAVIELAQASGIERLAKAERNPLYTSTYGTGLLLNHALEQGAKKILIGLGGSATNDGGAGLLAALGVKFFNQQAQEVKPRGGNLSTLVGVEADRLKKRLAGVSIEVASDVQNSLLGAEGATRIYGMQKGADAIMLDELENNMLHFARLSKQVLGKDYTAQAGTGAAGGAGFALMAYAGAKLLPGLETIARLTGLEEDMAWCNLVFTAEGRFDRQSLFGKVPISVARLAAKQDKSVIAFAGSIDPQALPLNQGNLRAVVPITLAPLKFHEALEHAREWLTYASQSTCSILDTILR